VKRLKIRPRCLNNELKWQFCFITSANSQVLHHQGGLSVIRSVCVKDYCESNRLISTNHDSAYQLEEITNFCWWPSKDGGSLYHFLHHCGIGYFRRFISIFSYSHWYDSHDTHKTDWRPQDSESKTFWDWSGIQPDPKTWIRILEHFQLTLQTAASKILIIYTFKILAPTDLYDFWHWLRKKTVNR